MISLSFSTIVRALQINIICHPSYNHCINLEVYDNLYSIYNDFIVRVNDCFITRLWVKIMNELQNFYSAQRTAWPNLLFQNEILNKICNIFTDNNPNRFIDFNELSKDLSKKWQDLVYNFLHIYGLVIIEIYTLSEKGQEILNKQFQKIGNLIQQLISRSINN